MTGRRGVAAAVAAVIVVFVLILSRAGGDDVRSGTVGVGPPSARPPAAVTPTPTRATTAPPSPAPSSPAAEGDDGVTEPPATATATAAVPDGRSTAAAFVTAWARPGRPAKAWLAGMAPYASPALLARFAGVDPTDVPATRLAGPARPVDGGRYAVPVTGPAGDGIAYPVVAQVGGRWQVTDLDYTGAGA